MLNSTVILEDLPVVAMSTSPEPIELTHVDAAIKRILLVVESEAKSRNDVTQDGIHITNATIQSALRYIRLSHDDEMPDVIMVSSDLENYTDKYLSDLREFSRKKSIPFILYSKKFDKIARSIAIEFGFDDYYSGNLTQSLVKKTEFIKKLKVYKMLRGERPYTFNHHHAQPKVKMWALKRTFDIAVSATALLFLSPILLLIAALIKLESRGPVFYISKRAGSGYKIFDFYKFRSMRVGADAELKALAAKNQYGDGLFFKIKDDPRITRLGNLLRNTSLDELPQLINVLKGDMSLVGNRPLPLYEAEKLTKDQIAWRFLAPAGITGLWQVTKRGKDNMSEDERIQLDMQYAMNNSFVYDIRILLSTIPALIQKEKV